VETQTPAPVAPGAPPSPGRRPRLVVAVAASVLVLLVATAGVAVVLGHWSDTETGGLQAS
jgi:3-oxoacyl-ACP reductase-like protein